MKLSSLTISFLPLLAAQVSAQEASAGTNKCPEWTDAHIFSPNPVMQPAQDAYVAVVAGILESDCFDEAGTAIECTVPLNITFPQAVAYSNECEKYGGDMWTYEFGPLCSPITRSTQTKVSPVLVCTSASCTDPILLIPPTRLVNLNNQSCGSSVKSNSPKKVDKPAVQTQPQCANWTQTQLFVPNPNMKPAEDAYLKYVADILGQECIADGAIKECDITIGSNDEVQAYYSACTEGGGVMYKYKMTPQCDSSVSISMEVDHMLICASASCDTVGVRNLYPQQEALFASFTAIGSSCGVATNGLEEYTLDPDGSSSAVAHHGFFGFGIAMMVALFF